MHVLGNAGRCVQCDGRPHRVCLLRIDSMLAQEVPRRIGAVDFESVIRAVVTSREPLVVKHGCDVKQLGVESNPLALARKGCEAVNTARVLEQEWSRDVSYELRCFSRHLAVVYGDAIDMGHVSSFR